MDYLIGLLLWGFFWYMVGRSRGIEKGKTEMAEIYHGKTD